MLHPFGRCMCGGDGQCEWCRRRDDEIALASFARDEVDRQHAEACADDGRPLRVLGLSEQLVVQGTPRATVGVDWSEPGGDVTAAVLADDLGRAESAHLAAPATVRSEATGLAPGVPVVGYTQRRAEVAINPPVVVCERCRLPRSLCCCSGRKPRSLSCAPSKRRRQLEDVEQMALAKWLDEQGVLWAHVPNEGVGKVQWWVKQRKKGLKPGVPDNLIFALDTQWNLASLAAYVNAGTVPARGWAVELKAPGDKSKGPTAAQRAWLADLEAGGWKTAWFKSAKEAIAWLQQQWGMA